MSEFSLWDLLAFGWFLGAWIVYAIIIELTPKGRTGLNALMNLYRDQWMAQMLARDVRIVDSQVTAALQNGTAFFASTSLIAVGGTLSLLRSSDVLLDALGKLPLGVSQSAGLWELKMMGLAIIFVYAFFKFAWSYRLYNYVAIMVGAAPAATAKDTSEAHTFAHRAARLCSDAGRHFNRGQRAFFFALGYLGWFLGPAPFALATTAVLVVTWRRQFNSESRRAFAANAVDTSIAGDAPGRRAKPSPSRRR